MGNCIGANNVPLAKRFFTVITKTSLAIFLIIGLFTIFARNQIVGLYTEDVAVKEIAIPVMILLAFVFFFDGMQLVL